MARGPGSWGIVKRLYRKILRVAFETVHAASSAVSVRPLPAFLMCVGGVPYCDEHAPVSARSFPAFLMCVTSRSSLSRSSSSRLFPVFLLCLLLLCPVVAFPVTLQSLYETAAPQGGYTKYLELDAGATYTGGIMIPDGEVVCIKGNGATIDLQTAIIQIQGPGARLDIDHCVIKNGCLPTAGYAQGALYFLGSHGDVVNNTIHGNTIGIRVYSTEPGAVTVMNNIIVRNTVTGLLCQLGSEPLVSYNDSWANRVNNYLIDCG